NVVRVGGVCRRGRGMKMRGGGWYSGFWQPANTSEVPPIGGAELHKNDNRPSGENSLDEVGRNYIVQILQQTGWRVEGPNGAARILGLNPSTLRSRMLKLGIRRPFRSKAQVPQ